MVMRIGPCMLTLVHSLIVLENWVKLRLMWQRLQVMFARGLRLEKKFPHHAHVFKILLNVTVKKVSISTRSTIKATYSTTNGQENKVTNPFPKSTDKKKQQLTLCALSYTLLSIYKQATIPITTSNKFIFEQLKVNGIIMQSTPKTIVLK